ncbi:metalloregulator ArsR/SmtB family transcription factor [Thermithiobacillus plumbiphilus]|uniref:Metalloregulator ArsR/SmtB family transcription factor n=1 Tax=Thermithiobacillus plumbiphilus TaxID=1729899 RepID=A0ABU9D9I8_9PROT
MEATTFYSLLADDTRLRILHLLLDGESLCVCELTAVLGLSQPKISRHLAALRIAGVLLDQRRGTWAYYRLHPELPGWALDVLKAGFAHWGELSPFLTDKQRARALRLEDPCARGA